MGGWIWKLRYTNRKYVLKCLLKSLPSFLLPLPCLLSPSLFSLFVIVRIKPMTPHTQAGALLLNYIPTLFLCFILRQHLTKLPRLVWNSFWSPNKPSSLSPSPLASLADGITGLSLAFPNSCVADKLSLTWLSWSVLRLAFNMPKFYYHSLDEVRLCLLLQGQSCLVS